MFINTSKRLHRLYCDFKLYVTELQFDRNDRPVKAYLFLTEYNTEVELFIDEILQVKRRRSKDESLMHIRVLKNQKLLLTIDHRKGNHFIYCDQSTYNTIIKQINESSPESSEFLAAIHEAAVSHNADAALDQLLQNRVLFIESGSLHTHAHELSHWVQHNEIILSPYYKEELEKHIPDPIERNKIIAIITKLQANNPGTFQTDIYVDMSVISNHAVDLSDEHEYLFALTAQQPIPRSQIIIVSANTEFIAKATFRGYAVYSPSLSGQIQANPQKTATIPSYQTEVDIFKVTNVAPLPPRSKKRRGTTHQNPFSSLKKSIRTAFYHLFF